MSQVDWILFFSNMSLLFLKLMSLFSCLGSVRILWCKPIASRWDYAPSFAAAVLMTLSFALWMWGISDVNWITCSCDDPFDLSQLLKPSPLSVVKPLKAELNVGLYGLSYRTKALKFEEGIQESYPIILNSYDISMKSLFFDCDAIGSGRPQSLEEWTKRFPCSTIRTFYVVGIVTYSLLTIAGALATLSILLLLWIGGDSAHVLSIRLIIIFAVIFSFGAVLTFFLAYLKTPSTCALSSPLLPWSEPYSAVGVQGWKHSVGCSCVLSICGIALAALALLLHVLGIATPSERTRKYGMLLGEVDEHGVGGAPELYGSEEVSKGWGEWSGSVEEEAMLASIEEEDLLANIELRTEDEQAKEEHNSLWNFDSRVGERDAV